MAILNTLLGTTNVAFFYTIFIWLLFDTLRLTKHNHISPFKHKPTLFAIITFLFTAIISLLNVAFLFYDYTYNYTIGYNSVSLTLTWVLATIVSLYSMKTRFGEKKRFPFVLILWWLYATIIAIISMSFKLVKIKNHETVNLWVLLSEDNIVDIVSLPMLLLLCFNTLPNVCVREESEIEQGLLQKECESESLSQDDEETFTKASLWSKLTFRWLNTIFKIGRIQKLELSHVPSVPHSETASSASSMLEESLRKQKLQGGSLTKAILHSIWNSLAFNAALAGIILINY